MTTYLSSLYPPSNFTILSQSNSPSHCTYIRLVSALYSAQSSRFSGQVVQVDDDYSDVVDSKDYVTPGEDGTRKIYCANAADSALDAEERPQDEPELSYCQPYGRAHGVTGE